MTLSDYTDPELGYIRLRSNPRARHITCRYVQKGELHVTIPPYLTRPQLDEALNNLRPKLLKHLQKAPVANLIDLDFTLYSPYIQLRLEQTQGVHFQLRFSKEAEENGSYTLFIPHKFQFNCPESDKALRKIITEILRKKAKEILPPLLSQLASRNGFRFTKVHIHNSHTRWGSCSTQKSISLSLYLILLPEELVHYVLLHELCHTVEMNHGPRFWELLDRCTQNQAKLLRRQLQEYRTRF